MTNVCYKELTRNRAHQPHDDSESSDTSMTQQERKDALRNVGVD